MKRSISFLLVLATLLSCFMLTVSADEQIVSDEGRLPFEDVKSNHWFFDAVKFCYANEIVSGMNGYTFGFSGQLTRAQFVTMLANLEGADTSAYSVTKFSDVKSNHWYYGAVAWAYSKGIVSGMTDTTFQPNGVLTRAQLAVVMRNYMQGKYEVTVNDSVLDNFTDKPKAEYWYYDAMKFAVSAELLSGNSDGTLAATGNVTRAQAAVIFKSFMEKYFYGACAHSFSEATCTAAAACTQCGLVNGLPVGHILSAYDCVTGGKCMVCNENVAPSDIIHNFAAATCTKASTCTRCGETRGEAKGHSWKAATCVAPKTCTVCKATEGGVKGHNWKAATCTAPKTCAVCNAKEGNALGHNYSGNSCTRCGTASPYAKVSYNIKQKGTYDKSTNCYTYFTNTNYGAVGVAYDASNGDLGVFFAGKYNSGAYDATTLYLPKTGTTCRFEYQYFTSTDDCLFEGYGYIEAKTFNESVIPGYSKYNGNASDLQTARENAGFEIHLALSDVNYLLSDLGGVNIAEFGFNYYK